MFGWVKAEEWFKKRDGYMRGARGCKEALTRSDGFWRYAADDERVTAAVARWVGKARRAHAVAMGREPITERFTVISNSEVISGALYATRPVPTHPDTYKAMGQTL